MADWEEKIQEVEVPAFIGTITSLVVKKQGYQETRERYLREMRNMTAVVNTVGDKQKLQSHINTFLSYAKNIEELDKTISGFDVAIARLIESKFVKFGFYINVPASANALGEEVPARTVKFYPWKALAEEEREVMTAEDLLFVSQAKTYFGGEHANIEFVDLKVGR